MSPTRPQDHEKVPPCAMVIFGAGGDLTKRLVVPALYNLAKQGLLPERFALVGTGRSDFDAQSWGAHLHDFLDKMVRSGTSEFTAREIEADIWDRLVAGLEFVRGDFTGAPLFEQLKTVLDRLDAAHDLGGNVLFYLAVPDRFFGPIVDRLGEAGLVHQDTDNKDGDGKTGWRRVVVEKPFGHDVASAKALNARLLRALKEEQIYRIDHFLGKETVQNIMAVRFANGLFEPIWNRDRIDHVQITVSEDIGIETRGNFYEKTGALRDMVPNHLFQLVAMTAMEPPVSFDAEAVRSKKAEVFKAARPITPDCAVRGQYGAGFVNDMAVRAYREEQDVAADSAIETYAAMKLTIDNWRWADVPFYLRTGKRMPARHTEIAIRFKHAPYTLFQETQHEALQADWLVLEIQPNEAIRLHFNAKRPGPHMILDDVSMNFQYSEWFKQAPAVGYETLLYDCFIGDATLFQRADQIEESWAIVAPLLEQWGKKRPQNFPNYAAGSAGPEEADALIKRDGRDWRPIG
jgi:glucose-6-phosphate 1-dehydrogenase